MRYPILIHSSGNWTQTVDWLSSRLVDQLSGSPALPTLALRSGPLDYQASNPGLGQGRYVLESGSYAYRTGLGQGLKTS